MLSNRSLAIAAIVTILLTALAFWLWLRDARPDRTAASPDEGPVEIPPEVYRSGGSTFSPRGPTVVAGEDGLSVRLDCDGYKMQRTIVNGRATFTDVPSPGCMLTLGDGDPRPFQPIFPGDDVRCALDAEGAVVWCSGSLAEKHAGNIVAWSWGKGQVFINGELAGEVPIENVRLPVGRHTIEFIGEKARSRWPLTVKADERIEIFFHAPTREGQVLSRRPASAQMMPRQP